MKEDSNKKKTTSKQRIKKIFSYVLALGIGAVFGLASLWALGLDFLKKADVGEFLCTYFLILAIFYVTILVHIIIHEAGHLICGLLSGYQFVSFRIFHITLAKYPEGYRWKKYSIPGTAGQCLLKPPAYENGTYAYKLYLSGGVLANFITGLFLVFSGVLVGLDSFGGRFLLVISIYAFYFGLTNGIPAKINGIANDGYDIFSIGKDEEQKYALWLTFYCNAQSQSGVPLGEIRELRELTISDEMIVNAKEPAIIMQIAMKLSVMLENGCFEEAYELINKILVQDGVLDLYQKEFKCEKLFLEIMLYHRPEEIERLYTKELQAYIKITQKTMISRVRLLYAYALLYKKDEAEADTWKREFEKLCRNYPNRGEIRQEQILMEHVQKKQ